MAQTLVKHSNKTNLTNGHTHKSTYDDVVKDLNLEFAVILGVATLSRPVGPGLPEETQRQVRSTRTPSYNYKGYVSLIFRLW